MCSTLDTMQGDFTAPRGVSDEALEVRFGPEPNHFADMSELAHPPTCEHCGAQGFCLVMCCRGQALRTCFECKRRGLE